MTLHVRLKVTCTVMSFGGILYLPLHCTVVICNNINQVVKVHVLLYFIDLILPCEF